MIALYYYVPVFRSQVTITTNTSAIVYIVCIIAAYIIGHIVSLLSSITVEKYVIWAYGYPSHYLMNDYIPGNYFIRESALESSKISKGRVTFLQNSKNILRFLVWLFLLPISLLDLLLSWLFGINHYYTRRLSSQQIAMIRGKCEILFRNIGISENSARLFQGDNHRIVHNYYYENAGKHSSRMDNCIAIYDFLRAMTFVMCVVFQIVFIRSLLTIRFGAPIDWEQCFLITVLAIVSYVLYMGFQKFYRKFTIENFMCLICDKNLDFPKKKEQILYTGAVPSGSPGSPNNPVSTFYK